MSAAAAPALRFTDGEWHRLHPATPLLRGGIWLLAVVFWLAANLRERLIGWIFRLPDVGDDPLDELGRYHLFGWAALVVLAVVAVAVGLFWLSWRASAFRIDAEDVTVRNGLLLRTVRTAKLDRIQGVTISRPVLARVLGAARMELEVAGQNANVRLEYLTSAAAEELRREVLRLASGRHAAASGEPGDEHAGTTPEQAILAEDGPSVVRVTPGRAVGSVLLSNATVMLVVVVVALLVAGAAGDFAPLAGFSAFPFIIASVTVAIRRIGRNLRYSIVSTPDGVRIASGVVSTRTEAVPPGRVHALRIEQPLLWRPAGWWRLSVNRAGHERGRQAQAVETSLAPVATLAEVRELVPLLVPDLAERPDLLLAGLTGRGDGEDFTPAPRRARWLRPVAWRRTGFRLTGASLLSRGGVLRRELVVVPQARMQSVSVSQRLLERALDVASVHPHVVAGPVGTKMRLIDRARAEALFLELAEAGTAARAADVSHRWAAPDAAR
ncbi:PH domain-containing protein [Amnibacterium endophyticum]|uniref:PH domain-containing protein n=1 Tax=Amnibacterium endophyticum TaxID=2109337 RepID=A0ABW4LGJ3_9MICO